MANILYLSTCNLAEYNAPTIHTIEICNNFSRLGNKVTLIVPAYEGNTNLKVEPNIKIIQVPFLHLKFLRALTYHVSFFIIILVHSLFFKSNLIYSREIPFGFEALVAKILFNIKYFLEINALSEEEEKKIKGLNMFKKISKISRILNYRFCDNIISLTEELKKELCKRYQISEKKIYIVPNGANIKIFHRKEKSICRKKISIQLKDFVVLYVGSFYPHHNLKMLLDLCQELKEKIKNIKFVFVGSGSEYKKIKTIAKENKLNDFVIFSGKVEYDEVPYWINASDICIHVADKRYKSLTETSFPQKIFEYLACGRPVISVANSNTMRKIIRKNKTGILLDIEKTDHKLLAKSIYSLYNKQKLLEKLGKNGEKIVREKYNWEKSAKKIFNILTDD